MQFSKKELKIVLTFFVIYIIFIHWSSYNEFSLLDLTKSIINERRLDIDIYYNDTTDRSFYNNHYYSNKAIGVPFLASPIYATWKFIYHNLFTQSISSSNNYLTDNTPILVGRWDTNGINSKVFIEPSYSLFEKISIILVTILTSSLFSALTLLVIYKISKYFTKNEKHKILLVLIFGLGTLAFPYATSFYTYPVADFFLLFSFYLLFKIKFEKISKERYIIFAGLSLGFALIVDNLSFSVILFLLVYFLYFTRRKKQIVIFLIAFFIATLPLLIYNFLIFHNPFEDTYKYLDPVIYSKSCFMNSNMYGFNLAFEPFIILRLLVYPYIGLFFYYPVLLLSFYGLIEMYKEHKEESLFILSSFLFLLILISMYSFWFAGNFGPRFLLIVLPFFVIPMVYSFKKINLKIIFILFIFSFVVNLSSTIQWTYVITSMMTKCCCIDSSYSDKINTFDLLTNPIIKENILYLANSGPKSTIIQSLFVPYRTFQIRDFLTYNESSNYEVENINLSNSPFGLVSMKISFITFLLIVALTIIIWAKSAVRFILKYKNVITILFVLSLFYFFNISELSYGENWFSNIFLNDQTYRWMSDNSTILLYAQKSEITNIQFTASSFYKNRTMELYINNKLISIIQIPTNKSQTFLTSSFRLNAGINILKIHSLEGCNETREVDSYSLDFRCISFLVWNLQKINKTYE
jgi:hypothetical protein